MLLDVAAMSFNWLEKDRDLHKRDIARAYGDFKRDAAKEASMAAQAAANAPLAQEARKAASCSVRKVGNWVGGKTVYSEGGFIKDLNPATGAIIATIPRSTAKDVDAAVAAAQAALPGWAARSLEERCAILDKVADVLERDLDAVAALESLDTGKAVGLAKRMDATRSRDNFRFFAKFAREFAAREAQSASYTNGHRNHTHRKPVGVVGLITPWNLPLYLLSWKVAPALAMGNTLVCKPSELTPLTADLLAKTCQAAGLPPGVLNIVHGYGHEAGQALVEHPDVKAISFTGGTVTGRKVAASAAAGLKKVSLELGGKNPTIVFADCDLEATVDGVVRSAFTNAGQICLCGSRILVEASLEDRFVRLLREKARGLVIGDPSDPATQMGSLVSQEHRAKVEAYLQLAREAGAKVVTGGARPEGEAFASGAFLEPTILTGLPQDSRCVQEEIFGPVVTVQGFTNEAEAVRLANDVPYGLAASVWTKDAAKAQRVSEALDTGMVWVNCWLERDLSVPFGGMKQSGVGREGGKWSLEFFSEARNLCVKDGSTE